MKMTRRYCMQLQQLAQRMAVFTTC